MMVRLSIWFCLTWMERWWLLCVLFSGTADYTLAGLVVSDKDVKWRRILNLNFFVLFSFVTLASFSGQSYFIPATCWYPRVYYINTTYRKFSAICFYFCFRIRHLVHHNPHNICIEEKILMPNNIQGENWNRHCISHRDVLI